MGKKTVIVSNSVFVSMNNVMDSEPGSCSSRLSYRSYVGGGHTGQVVLKLGHLRILQNNRSYKAS